MTSLIQKICDEIQAQTGGEEARSQVEQRIRQLTMPPRAMGRALDLVEELTFAATQQVRCQKPHLILFAGEHGVVSEGVSAFPAEVTRQMVINFIRGGAAINQLSRSAGAGLTVVNIATGGKYPEHEQLVNSPVATGTHNLMIEAALENKAMEEAIELGIKLAEEKIREGADLLACGEMGIGNTTASACLCCIFTGASVEEAVGRGTGIDEAGLQRKKEVVAKALSRVTTDPKQPLEMLKQYGGYELAGIVGVILACAKERVPFILDGFNVTAAAVVATALAPRANEILIASHQGEEPGHQHLLKHLNKKPYLEWGLRLGEGSGAALMFPLCKASCQMVADMATFEEAAVSNK